MQWHCGWLMWFLTLRENTLPFIIPLNPKNKKRNDQNIFAYVESEMYFLLIFMRTIFFLDFS